MEDSSKQWDMCSLTLICIIVILVLEIWLGLGCESETSALLGSKANHNTRLGETSSSGREHKLLNIHFFWVVDALERKKTPAESVVIKA